jgi:Rrf2 family protein
LFNLSGAVNLAFHAMALLASQPKGEPSTTLELSRRMGVSAHHLSKVLQRLVRAGLLTSQRGPAGGFVLGRPPGKITLQDIYVATQGELPKSGCLLSEPICDGSCCLLGGLMETFQQQVQHHFSNTKLSAVAPGFSRARAPSP